MLRELGKSVIIYGVASSVSKFIGIFMVPIFSRYYSPTDYGTIDLVLTIVSLITIFGMLQLESAISRFYFEVSKKSLKEYISTGFWTILIMSTFLSALLVIGSDLITRTLFSTTQHSAVLELGGVNVILINIFAYLTVILRFRNRPLFYALIIFAQVFITAVTTIIFIFIYDQGIKAFFIGQIAGLLVGNSILLIYLRKFIILTIKTKVLLEFFRYSLPQVPAVAGSWLNSYANRFLMIGYLTISDIGIYTVALKIASIFNLVDNSFRMAWEPFLWKTVKTPNHRELLRKLSSMITMVVFFLSLLFILYSRELLLILSTPEYFNALPIAQILFYAFTFPVLVHVFGIGTSISKKTIYNTLSFFCGTFINIGLLFILVPRYGLPAVPASLAASNIFIFTFMFYLSEKQYYIGFHYRQQFLLMTVFSTLAYLIVLYEPTLIAKLALVVALLMVSIYKRREIQSFLDRNSNTISAK